MQDDLNLITAWLLNNKLTLNSAKTKLMLLKQGQPITDDTNFDVFISRQAIERVSHFKYLGITIQNNLKWNLHTDKICNKIAGISSVIKRLGTKINNATRISFYYAMINSHLSYLSPGEHQLTKSK